MQHHVRLALVSVAVLAVGIGVMVREWNGHMVNAPLVIGVGLAISGFLAAFVVLALWPFVGQRRELDDAYESGYDAGYAKGRRAGTPRVIRLPQADDGKRSRAWRTSDG